MIAALIIAAVLGGDIPLDNPRNEARAQELMREIRCVVCQSESINESDADIAAELRNIVREQVAAGRSDDEIHDYLTARYGDFILLDPPFKTETLILWLGPFALAVAGMAAAAMILRRRVPAGAATAELTPAQRNRLDELLVDGDSGDGSKAS